MYTSLLESLYQDQVAEVQANARSRPFPVERGVKQGDPLSALLFIAVMQHCFDKLRAKWEPHALEQMKGDLLSNLRFADDVILFANTGEYLEQMLEDLVEASAEYGLKLNYSNAKLHISMKNPIPLSSLPKGIHLQQDTFPTGKPKWLAIKKQPDCRCSGLSRTPTNFLLLSTIMPWTCFGSLAARLAGRVDGLTFRRPTGGLLDKRSASSSV